MIADGAERAAALATAAALIRGSRLSRCCCFHDRRSRRRSGGPGGRFAGLFRDIDQTVCPASQARCAVRLGTGTHRARTGRQSRRSPRSFTTIPQSHARRGALGCACLRRRNCSPICGVRKRRSPRPPTFTHRLLREALAVANPENAAEFDHWDAARELSERESLCSQRKPVRKGRDYGHARKLDGTLVAATRFLCLEPDAHWVPSAAGGQPVGPDCRALLGRRHGVLALCDVNKSVVPDALAARD